MPYEWITPPPDGKAAELHAWPHRSLSPEGFVTFFGITFLLVLVPLSAVVGSPILWGLLPFVLGAFWAAWAFMKRSYADARLREDLSLWDDRIELIRSNPRGPAQSWQANPYWVKLKLHETGGPVEQYVTLEGAGRTVEIGAFLSPEERVALYHDLQDRLARLGQPSQ
ncbi:DUF2244 domain-containing protein [Psychromarinibacter sp. C21-152]|uniref:DUF2244 domain-containing protein n=1 Tax=Psychromarinibacter sediminicola TaxID=3033385 RepID=A0AAE3NRA2_9RHOB|nr:DUF2244 domain-containing protein [Psychromarinibacter sediminicola]MDF0599505.1 DUF2244 domain-containing protein [Psychromarinibacter sediminicola]